MDTEELINNLKKEIEEQLDQCQEDETGTFTPKVCSFIKDPDGRKKVVQLIINYVSGEGMSISEAILEIERDFTMIED
jgi:hypothetical protein